MHVVVIGAGPAGLAAGRYALAQGFDCTVVERHTTAGGLAATWRRGDFVVEGGVRLLTGVNPGLQAYDLYHDLGLLPGLPLTELSTLCRFLDERTDRAIEISRNMDRLALELRQLSPDDAEHVEDLIRGTKRMGLLDWAKMERPLEIMTTGDRLRQTWRLRHQLRYFGGIFVQPVSALVAKISHPLIKSLLLTLCAPETPLWYLMMLLSTFSHGQRALLTEGSISLVGRMVAGLEEAGGKLETNCCVKEILIEQTAHDDRAVGVRLANEEVLEADYVVSAADAYSTLYEMLHGKYLDSAAKTRFREWKLCRPMIQVSLGVARRFTGETPLKVLMLRRPFFVGETTVENLSLRIFNYAPHFAPPRKTMIQASFETSWSHWNALAEGDRSGYEAEKERVAKEVIRRLELHYPGISRQVELVDVATPYTTWRYTRNLQGANEAWLPIPEVIVSAIPRTLPGLAHLVLAGHWVAPGNGVAGSILSGKHAVQLICHQSQTPFHNIRT